MIAELTKRFQQVKKCKPLHVNELLDYLQKSYVNGELSIVEYKKIYRELDQLHAEKPQSFEFAAV